MNSLRVGLKPQATILNAQYEVTQSLFTFYVLIYFIDFVFPKTQAFGGYCWD